MASSLVHPRVYSCGPTSGISQCRGRDPATPLPLTWLLRPVFIKWIFRRTTWQGLGKKYGDVWWKLFIPSCFDAQPWRDGVESRRTQGKRVRHQRQSRCGAQHQEAAGGTCGGQSGEGAEGSHIPHKSVLETAAEIMSFTLAANQLSAHCDWDT